MPFQYFFHKNNPWRTALDEKKVVVLDTDEQHSKALCTMLEAKQYHAVPMQSLDSIQGYIKNITAWQLFWMLTMSPSTIGAFGS